MVDPQDEMMDDGRPPEDGDTPFDDWAILELMGHRTLYGRVREVVVFGATMVRVDIPKDQPLTQFYGPFAIYCMTPTTEEVVRQHWQERQAERLQYYGEEDDT